MEKLEQILHAEDAARTAADDARITAARLVSEARAKAVEIQRSGREDARNAAVALSGEILAAAREDATSLAASAAGESRTVLERASARADEALAAVLQVLKGR